MPDPFLKPLSGRAGILAQTASLLVTAFLIWNSTVRSRLLFQPLRVVIGEALLYACLAWFFAAVITLILFLFLPRPQASRLLTATFRTASVAVWLAPACILLSHLSPATLAAALALVVMATRLFYSEWTAAHPRPPEAVTKPLGLFGGFTVRRPIVTRELLTGLAAAVALQMGMVSVWWRHPMLAGAWFALSAATVTLFAMVSGVLAHESAPSMPRSLLGIAATILLAAGLTVGGIRVMRGHGGTGEGDYEGGPAGGGKGAVASAREVLRDLFGDDAAGDPKNRPPGASPALFPPVTPGILPDGSFPGVILWPEVRPVTRIVAPLPRGPAAGIAPQRPIGIPFDGQYLLYRWPQRRPPPTSILQRGSPASLAFSTVDHWPLNMDAIQKFDEPIDLSCCSAIRVDIWNADRYPGTVSLVLSADDRPLGTAPVRSTPDLQRDPVTAVPESVDFRISGGGLCKELKVNFHRDRQRADKSARIAIERFVLVP